MVQHGPDCKLGYRGPPAGLQASPCEAGWSGLLSMVERPVCNPACSPRSCQSPSHSEPVSLQCTCWCCWSKQVVPQSAGTRGRGSRAFAVKAPPTDQLPSLPVQDLAWPSHGGWLS